MDSMRLLLRSLRGGGFVFGKAKNAQKKQMKNNEKK